MVILQPLRLTVTERAGPRHAHRAAPGAIRPLLGLPRASSTLLSLSLQEEEASSQRESPGGWEQKVGAGRT